MGCCGSNRGGVFGGGSGNSVEGVAVSLHDGDLPPIHSSWLDAQAEIDPTLIPPEIQRSIVDGVVKISIIVDSRTTITIFNPEKVLRSIWRKLLWDRFPTLTTGIVKPKPTPPILKPPLLGD